MSNLLDLLNTEADVLFVIKKSDLLEFASLLIEKSKKELEDAVTSKVPDTYLTRLQTCEALHVDQATLWRWNRNGYLCQIEVGGKKFYRNSDVQKLLSVGKKLYTKKAEL